MTGSDSAERSTGNYYERLCPAELYGRICRKYSTVLLSQFREDLDWNDPSQGELNQVVDLRNREFSFFFKDDWKVNNSLTLNLGLRYEYYGVPWEDSGKTAALVGGSSEPVGDIGWRFQHLDAGESRRGTEWRHFRHMNLLGRIRRIRIAARGTRI